MMQVVYTFVFSFVGLAYLVLAVIAYLLARALFGGFSRRLDATDGLLCIGIAVLWPLVALLLLLILVKVRCGRIWKKLSFGSKQPKWRRKA